MPFTAEVKLTVNQAVTDAEYYGEAEISVPERGIASRKLGFVLLHPNDVSKFWLSILKNDEPFIEWSMSKSDNEQLEEFTDEQTALFLLLFRLIVNGVKEAQRTLGGTTGNGPLAERVEETIRSVGSEPVASISFARAFTWRDEDADVFENTCSALA